MGKTDSVVDRFLLREGWYFLRWTLDREMVRNHDRIGWACVGAAAVSAPMMAWLVEPQAAVIGIGLVVAGAVHLGITNWARKHPEVRDRKAPKLSRRARAMMKKLVTKVAGRDLAGQKYYTKYMRQSADKARGHAENLLQAEAFSSFELVATAYNKAIGTASDLGPAAAPTVRAMHEAMAEALDRIAALDQFPERHERHSAHLALLAARFDELSQALESHVGSDSDALRQRLAAWTEALAFDAPKSQEERI